MIPIFDPSSTAAWSPFNITNAFFFPSGLIKVLTLLTSTSNLCLKVLLMSVLVESLWTINTRVFLSSINFVADSPTNGYWITLYLLIVPAFWILCLKYFGVLLRAKVVGLLKVGVVQTLCLLFKCCPFLRTALALVAWVWSAGVSDLFTFFTLFTGARGAI